MVKMPVGQQDAVKDESGLFDCRCDYLGSCTGIYDHGVTVTAEQVAICADKTLGESFDLHLASPFCIRNPYLIVL
jgi:hypothetical protein